MGLFLVISALSATDTGMMLMEMIDQSTILRPMYDGNLFMKIAVQASPELCKGICGQRNCTVRKK